ncbi:MAG: HAD-IA family hydrolase [Kordiimonas sp.]
MPKFSVKSVIFDLDGTLVDTAKDLHAATNHVLEHHGRESVPLSAVKEDVGFGALRLLQKGFNRTGGCDGIDLESAKATFLDYYIENIAVHSSLFEGGEHMLESLAKANISIGVCTNKPYKLAVKLLEDLGLSHFFAAIRGGDSFPFKKPDPRHLLETASLTGKGPYIMVGDASPDILAAKAANIPVIAADYGYPDVDIKALKPDATIQSLGEVAELVVS